MVTIMMKAKPPQSNLIGNIMTNPTGTIDIVMCVCVCATPKTISNLLSFLRIFGPV